MQLCVNTHSFSFCHTEWYLIRTSILGYVAVLNVHLGHCRLDDLLRTIQPHIDQKNHQQYRYVELSTLFQNHSSNAVFPIFQVNTVQPFVLLLPRTLVATVFWLYHCWRWALDSMVASIPDSKSIIWTLHLVLPESWWHLPIAQPIWPACWHPLSPDIWLKATYVPQSFEFHTAQLGIWYKLMIKYFFLNFKQPTMGQWQKVFFISAAVYIFCATFYNAFGSGERQPWDNPLLDDPEPSNQQNGGYQANQTTIQLQPQTQALANGNGVYESRQ